MNIDQPKKNSASPLVRSLARRFWRAQRGANLVEYIMLVGLIAILCIVAFNQFGSSIKTKMGEEKAAIDGINTTSQ
jgi:pilus assembly protein Flp/PilA